MSNERHILFRPTTWNINDRKGQIWLLSKVVPDTPVGPNQNGSVLFAISNENFRNFGLNGKCLQVTVRISGLTKSIILVVKSSKLIHSLAMNLFLAIADLPRITDITTPPILKTGENVNLSCIASGLSLLNVTWHRGQNVVSNHGNGTSTVVIRLFNITQEDWGEYTCVTQNAAGEDRRTVFLRS